MIALLIIATFFAAILIDHLLLRRGVPIAATTAAPRPMPRIVGGFAIRDNYRYHPGHTWAVAETPNLVRVGIDDFAAKLAGNVETIAVPERGQWIRQGQKIIAMKADGHELELVSPIEGTVVEVNTDAAATKADPYGDGWLLTVNSPDAKTNFRNLLGGSAARRWLDDAAARLRAFTAIPQGAFAQDGGVAVDDILENLAEADVKKLNAEFFAIN
jgi:glycine cleavage system H lipoate-binding protein